MTFTEETRHLIEQAIFLVDLAFVAGAALAGLYLWWVFRQRHEDAPFLTLLYRICLRVSVAAVVVLGYIALAQIDRTPGAPWGSIIISLCFIAMLTVPISVALRWFLERRLSS